MSDHNVQGGTLSVRAVVLTGVRGAGKSTLAAELVRRGAFCIVQAVTTRAPRADDLNGAYEHIDRDTFVQDESDGRLAVSSTYADHLYGIRIAQLELASSGGAIPLMTLTPESAVRFLQNGTYKGSLGFFLDAEDDVLDERLQRRDGNLPTSSTHLRKMDRHFDGAPLIRLDSTGPTAQLGDIVLAALDNG